MRSGNALRSAFASSRTFLGIQIVLSALTAAVACSPALSQTLREMPPIFSNPVNGKPVDILGVAPGMSLAEAKPIIDAHNAKFSKTGAWKYPDPVTRQQYIWFYGGGVTGDFRRRPADNLVVHLSSESTGNQVLGVSRWVVFAEGEQPLFKELLKALVDKYGKYSRVVGLDDAYRLRAGPQAGNQEVPIIPDFCIEYRWYLNKVGEEKLYAMNFSMGGVLASLFNSVTGLEQANQLYLAYHKDIPKVVALDAGFNVAARICTAHLPDRAYSLELKVLDIARAMAAGFLEQQKLLERDQAVQRQKQSIPAASVPKL